MWKAAQEADRLITRHGPNRGMRRHGARMRTASQTMRHNASPLAMRQKLDVARLFRRALRALPETIDGQPPQPLPAQCPVTLDQLLAEDV